MSQDAKKTRTQAALEAAGIDHARLGSALGRDRSYVQGALSGRLGAEEAGAVCRVIGEMAGLSAAEKRGIFEELVNWPGEQDDPLFGRISSEHPMDELYDAVRERHGPSYKRPPKDP